MCSFFHSRNCHVTSLVTLTCLIAVHGAVLSSRIYRTVPRKNSLTSMSYIEGAQDCDEMKSDEPDRWHVIDLRGHMECAHTHTCTLFPK